MPMPRHVGAKPELLASDALNVASAPLRSPVAICREPVLKACAASLLSLFGGSFFGGSFFGGSFFGGSFFTTISGFFFGGSFFGGSFFGGSFFTTISGFFS